MAIVEQAVILAAGRGTRLQRPDPAVILDPETEVIVQQGIKSLVPINGRPYMDYSIDRLITAGIRRLCFILAPDSAPLQAYIQTLSKRFPDLQAEWQIQPTPRGSGHALRFARPATGDREFLMLNSDNLYPETVLKDLADAPLGACYCVGFEQESLNDHSNFDASRVSSLGILVPTRDNPDILDRVVEKPDDPDSLRSNGKLWITMNIWRFTPEIYDFCDNVALSARGEYELTSAVQDLSQSGSPVRMLHSFEGVLDLTSRADIARLQNMLTP